MSMDYETYKAQVVEELVKLFGAHTLEFFSRRHEFREQFDKGTGPAEVAMKLFEEHGG